MRAAIMPDTLPFVKRLIKSLILTAILLSVSLAQAQTVPDVIYSHGNILTGAHLRPNDPSATPAKVTALAIADGKILAAGADATILKLKGPKTKIIDLQGAFAMPGFNDAHTHSGEAGRQKLSVNLVGVRSLSEMQLVRVLKLFEGEKVFPIRVVLNAGDTV